MEDDDTRESARGRTARCGRCGAIRQAPRGRGSAGAGARKPDAPHRTYATRAGRSLPTGPSAGREETSEESDSESAITAVWRARERCFYIKISIYPQTHARHRGGYTSGTARAETGYTRVGAVKPRARTQDPIARAPRRGGRHALTRRYLCAQRWREPNDGTGGRSPRRRVGSQSFQGRNPARQGSTIDATGPQARPMSCFP